MVTRATETIAQDIGYETKLDDSSYEGNLLGVGVNTPIGIISNETKDGGSNEPDYIVMSSRYGEIGTARNKVGQVKGNPYVAVRLSHPKIVWSSIFVNLGQAYGGEDCDYALLWNPAN